MLNVSNLFHKIIWLSISGIIGLLLSECSASKDSNQVRDLELFSIDYVSSRNHFITLCLGYPGQNKIGRIQIPSQTDSELSIDYCHIRPKGPRDRLLVITSGIHGAEAPAGSTIQRSFMIHKASSAHEAGLGLLFIHAVNPYGFKYFRRTTESNVDLNRNFILEAEYAKHKNLEYDKLAHFLKPDLPASTGMLADLEFNAEFMGYFFDSGKQKMRQAIVQGQYTHARGLFYGGQLAEPHVKRLTTLFQNILPEYRAILMVDLHTGYGERGLLQLFPNAPQTEKIKKNTELVFKGISIHWGNQSGYYTTHGQFVDYVATLAKPNQIFVPMVIEYGTINSQSTMGSIDALRRMVRENQGHFHGFSDKESQKKIDYEFREMFLPEDLEWRSAILTATELLWKKVLRNFLELPLPEK